MQKLVSYCLMTYNQEDFIQDAIESAFSQEYENLEIIISDDCSTDRTFDIVQDLVSKYSGLHKVIVNRNSKNLGIRAHCNKLLYEIASGEYVLLAAGDDVSDKLRTKEYVDIFEKFPRVMSVSCKSIEVDKHMNPWQNITQWDGSFSIYTVEDYIDFKDFIIKSGDSRGLRRDVIRSFPPLEFTKAEDIYLFIRSFLLGSVCYIRKPLVKRRHHGANVSEMKCTKGDLDAFVLQTQTDINFAFSKGIINDWVYQKMKRKCDEVHKFFYYNLTPIYYSLPVFFFYVKKKMLNAMKRFSRLPRRICNLMKKIVDKLGFKV